MFFALIHLGDTKNLSHYPRLNELHEVNDKKMSTAQANMNLATIQPLSNLLSAEMDAVNQVIIERMSSHVPLIPQLAGHLIAAGGKRLRPLLTLAGAYAGCGEKAAIPQTARVLAAAVEFIHNAT